MDPMSGFKRAAFFHSAQDGQQFNGGHLADRPAT
jgi:hypothetical protein